MKAFYIDPILKFVAEVNYIGDDYKEIYKWIDARTFDVVTLNGYGDGMYVDDARKYFNRSRYNMRVRGQHIKDEYKGTGATAYGQNIEQSTHLRVYIEEK